MSAVRRAVPRFSTGPVNAADSLVAGRCREIYKLGVEKAAGIAPYGTSVEDLTALDEAIKAYEPLTAGTALQPAWLFESSVRLGGWRHAAGALASHLLRKAQA